MQRFETKIHLASYGILAAIALIGTAVLLFSTAWGIGLSPDSVRYIDAARNLATRYALVETRANGVFVPMSDVHPMFPVVLGVVRLVGGPDPWVGARWLNALLFGANILLIGVVIRKLTDISLWPAILGSVLMLTSVDMLGVHSMAWTEPLFLFFGFLGVLLLSTYLETRKTGLLLMAAIAVALAFFDRQAGIVLVAAGAIALFFLRSDSYKRRVIDTALFAGIASSLALLWSGRNLWISDRMANRQIGFHANFNLLYRTARLGFDTVSRWLLPDVISVRTRIAIVLLLLTILCGIGVLFLWKTAWSNKRNVIVSRSDYLICLLLISSALYVGLLMFTLLFHYASTPLDYRLLSPLYVVALILAVTLVHRMVRLLELKSRRATLLIISVCLLFVAFYLWRSSVWVLQVHEFGQGFASKSWQESELIQQIGELDPCVKIYTNGTNPIFFLTGRIAHGLPIKVNSFTGRPNEGLSDGISQVQKSLESEDAVLVYFNNINWWSGYLLSEDEIQTLMPLDLVKRSADGAIYKARDQREDS